MRKPLRRSLLWLMLTLLWVTALPAVAQALSPVSQIEFDVAVEADGTLRVVERRTLQDARTIEFVEMILPETTTFELESLRDGNGTFALYDGTATDRTYKIERVGKVAYVEWQSPTPAATVTLTYRLRNMAILHADAVEFYWPAVAGGVRGVKRVDLHLTMPATGGAHLYAYGGEQGGVTVRKSPFRVAATDLDKNRSFEIRLLLPKAALPNASGQAGTQSMALLVAQEERRIESEMSRASSRWMAHWALMLALPATVLLYWFTVRRASPERDPASLTPSELTAIPPAAVGWIYDSSWFDFACAQLMHLEARGDLVVDTSGLHMTLRRAPGASLDEADAALLALFHITEEPIAIPDISDRWIAHKGQYQADLAGWLKLVGAQVPAEWFARPSPLWAWVSGGLCLVFGVVSRSWMEWIALWALGGLMIFMGIKRRWLSPLGESYIARWVSIYYEAIRKVPQGIPAPYLLAVEVGDDHLERAMGKERYHVVKALYIYLEELA